MMRGKNNGRIHEGSGDKADSLNLLDSTDSDVEWLSLPPLKGKKPKKKKGLKVQRETGWSIWGMLKVFLILSVIGAVVLLCVVSVWLTSQLSDVREQLKQMEGRSMGSTDDVEKLFKEIAAVNKTLDRHSKTLNTVISEISSMNKTVTQVSGRVDKLGEGLKAAPELKQLPEKLLTVSQTVATMGSDVKNMKDTVDKVPPFMKTTSDSIDSLKQQFQAIKDQVDGSEATPDRESMKPELANVIQGLSNQLQTVNSTVSTQVSVLMKSSSQQEERVVKLEETTQMLMKNLSSISTDHTTIASEHDSLTDDYTSEKFKSSVTDIVQDMLKDGSPLPSNSNTEAIMANITKVIGTLKELEEKYENIESKSGPESGPEGDNNNEYVSMKMFQTLGEGFETKVENLNSSFISLKADVTTMSQMLTKQSNTVTNLTHQIDATKLYLASLMQKLAGATSAPVVTEGPGTKKVSKIPEEPVTTKEQIELTTKGSKTTTVKPETSPPGQGTIHVDFITSPEELEKFYSRWSDGYSHEVNYEDLDGFLGASTPKEEDLKQFDEDKNGLYSLAEFSKAFGFPLKTTTTETVTEPAPPRR